MKGLDTATLIRFERLQDSDNPYYDSLVIMKEDKYHVKHFHTETGLLSTGTSYGTLYSASRAFETILNIVT